MLTMDYSCWSIYVDREEVTDGWQRAGWAIDWPIPARTATVKSLPGLQRLVSRYPCTQHPDKEDLDPFAWMSGRTSAPPREPEHDENGYPIVHDARLWPPLDFAAMSADFDALHVTSQGISETFLTKPSTTAWSVETVLWINPVFEVLTPMRVRRWSGAKDFIDSLTDSQPER